MVARILNEAHALVIKTCKFRSCPYHNYKQHRVYFNGQLIEKTYDAVIRILARHRFHQEKAKRSSR